MKNILLLILLTVILLNAIAQNIFPSSGNAGIGTTSPQSLLHLNNSIDARKTFRIYWNNDLSKYLSIWQGTGGGAIDPIGTGVLYLGYDQTTKVIIGNSNFNPLARLNIAGSIFVNATRTNTIFDGNIEADKANLIGSEGYWALRTATNNSCNLDVYNSSSPIAAMTVLQNGNVGIGTTSPDAKLTINGTVHSKEVKVDLAVPGPDYVFEPAYNLRPLAEIETYIKANKHLPEVPSAKEMEANGVNVSEMNMLLLKKVEELTLYVIELKKEIENLKKE